MGRLFTVLLSISIATVASADPLVVVSVTRTGTGSAAGVKPGDLLLSWSRGDHGGELDSPLELAAVESEEGSRGELQVDVRRGKKSFVARLTRPFGLTTRPNLSADQLSRLQDAEQKILAGDRKNGPTAIRRLADEASRSGQILEAFWLRLRSGEALLEAGDAKAAASELARALDEGDEVLRPKHVAIAAERRAEVLRKLGRKAEAEQAERLAVRLSGNRVAGALLRLRLGRAALARGEGASVDSLLGEGWRSLVGVPGVDGERREMAKLLARIAEQDGRPDDAAEWREAAESPARPIRRAVAEPEPEELDPLPPAKPKSAVGKPATSSSKPGAKTPAAGKKPKRSR